MDLASALTSFVTIFVVIDPIGMAPLFVAMTSDMEATHRRVVAVRACAIAAGILMVFGLFGNALLATLGISLAAFRIAGGILLFLIAVDMLFEKRTERREGRKTDTHDHDPSVFPLATPLIAGPGSMAAMILLNSGTDMTWLDKVQVQLVMLSVVGLVLVLFFMSGLIARALGRTGILVVTRLLGMLLAALSVQFVLNGLVDLGVLGG